MTSAEPPVMVRRDGRVLEMILNRPGALNALTLEMCLGLRAAAVEAADDDTVHAVLLTSRGRGFCAGADFSLSDAADDPLRELFHPLFLALRALNKPLVAALRGPVAGSGIGLACLADVRIVAEDVQFIPAFEKLGVSPDFGIGRTLPEIVGYSRAFDLMASGTRLDASAALAWGLANEVVPADSLDDVSSRKARSFAEKPGRLVQLTKELMRPVERESMADHLEREAVLQSRALEDGPTREAVRLATARHAHETS